MAVGVANLCEKTLFGLKTPGIAVESALLAGCFLNKIQPVEGKYHAENSHI